MKIYIVCRHYWETNHDSIVAAFKNSDDALKRIEEENMVALKIDAHYYAWIAERNYYK